MSNTIGTNDISYLQSQVAGTRTEASQNQLDQDAFMQLLIAQMKNQDPTAPIDANEQLVQLAQFSQVEGLDKINAKMDELVSAQSSAQALQASSLVGRTVTVETSSFNYGGGNMSAQVDLPSSTGNLEIQVLDQIGREVDRISMGQESAGTINFNWSGDSTGPRRFVALATEATGDTYAVPVYLNANVNSVSLSGNSTTLNLNSVGPVALADVRAITESTQENNDVN